jgi:hypothetical protein
MTGYTVHTGSTVKFSVGWDNIFGGASRAAMAGGKKKPAKSQTAKTLTNKKKVRHSKTTSR